MKTALILWVILIGMVTFAIFGIDKRLAIRHRRRISEKTLLVLSAIGGAFGAYAGMKFFHHKTMKRKFRLVSVFAIMWGILLFACILNII